MPAGRILPAWRNAMASASGSCNSPKCPLWVKKQPLRTTSIKGCFAPESRHKFTHAGTTALCHLRTSCRSSLLCLPTQ
jgi:hypothetical protein